MDDLSDLQGESFCYLTTRGRVTGTPHEIEIWFAARDMTIYMLSGGGERSDWVKNLLAMADVRVQIRDSELGGRARLVHDADEEKWAREALLSKYSTGYGGDLTGWSKSALPVAVDLVLGQAATSASSG